MEKNFFKQREIPIDIEGPAGNLQLLVNGIDREREPSGIAVICHPHPQYGGTLDNKVVHTVARAFRDAGITAVRFNFRGVGRSEGSFAQGVGEREDLQAVIDWIKKRQPELPVWLAGFSFGGAVAAAFARDHRDVIAGLVLVSPALGNYGFDEKDSLSVPGLLLQGEEDDVLAPEIVYQWVDRHSDAGIQLQRMPKAGHFYHGQLTELKTHVKNYLDQVC